MKLALALVVVLALPTLACAQPRGRSAAGRSEGSGGDPTDGYDALLRVAVRDGGVDYGLLRARLAELRTFHDWLATHGPGSTPAVFATLSSRKAYWLNAYNVTVLRAVAEAPPSMDNVLTWLPDSGFFRARRWRIDGRLRTLDEIEHRELREPFRDARIHMALHCAARSCPPLRPEAYRADRLERQLDEQSSRYFNTPSRVVVDEATRTVHLSQLFEWFAEDFATGVPGRVPSPMRGVLAFVHSFASPPLRARLEALCGPDGARCSLAYIPYDWSLNRLR